MTTKRLTKRELAWAQRTLKEIHDYAEEVRRSEGNREAGSFLSWPDTRRRASEAIAVLRAWHYPMPDWLVKSWAYYRSIHWHALPDSAALDGGN